MSFFLCELLGSGMDEEYEVSVFKECILSVLLFVDGVKDMNFKKSLQNLRQKNKSDEITTEEVLRNADFRFLAQFITNVGIIIKRKQTGITATAQRKIAREIKTACAFGFMPFTTIGTKAFTFGKTIENRDQDFEYKVTDDDDDVGNARVQRIGSG